VECPVGAAGLSSKGAAIDQTRCIGCGACYDNCASHAIDQLDHLPEPSESGRTAQ
jgi:uncharacterized Fe-S center protein